MNFDGTSNHDAELDRVALNKPVRFDAVKTGRDDVALLGFTSGTTGEPKATMHFHRDLLIIADGYAREVLNVTPDDVFVGSPPLAFTFGLGGLAIFPLRFGATATLLENAAPAEIVKIIRKQEEIGLRIVRRADPAPAQPGPEQAPGADRAAGQAARPEPEAEFDHTRQCIRVARPSPRERSRRRAPS